MDQVSWFFEDGCLENVQVSFNVWTNLVFEIIQVSCFAKALIYHAHAQFI